MRAPLLCFLFLPLYVFPFSAQAAVSFRAYINIHYLAEDKVSSFDKELSAAYPLASPGFLSRSKTYKELLALRILKDAEEKSLRSRLASLSREGQDEFLAQLAGLDPAERVALNDLVATVSFGNGRAAPLFYANLPQLLEARKAAASFTNAHIKTARADKQLRASVTALAATFDLSTRGGERAERIRPGSGPEGTVNGREFPLNTWALTFDDGPHETRTREILANLKSLKKKATFFWVVEELEKTPVAGIPLEAIAQGQSVNNHSWTHLNLDKAPDADRKKEIIESTERDIGYFGARPQFFRLPFGAGLSNKAPRQLIADQGMIHVFWTVDTLDWQDKDPAVVLERTKKQMATEKRGIILFHDIHAQSVEASKQLLKWSAGFDGTPQAHRWVTLPEILEQMNKSEVLGEIPAAPAPRKRAAIFPLDRKPVLR